MLNPIEKIYFFSLKVFTVFEPLADEAIRSNENARRSHSCDRFFHGDLSLRLQI